MPRTVWNCGEGIRFIRILGSNFPASPFLLHLVATYHSTPAQKAKQRIVFVAQCNLQTSRNSNFSLTTAFSLGNLEGFLQRLEPSQDSRM